VKKITKAVFPVAGMGTRFLPATKISPKEMLPIVDKPLIQYAVEEAIDAGIRDLIFITGRNKRAIEDHFDTAYELEKELELKSKNTLLDVVQNIIPSHVNCIFVRQSQPLGLGHAVLCAQPIIREEHFAVILADDLIKHDIGATAQLLSHYEKSGGSILGVAEVPPETASSYGIVSTLQNHHFHKVSDLVEKPSPGTAPSNLAVIGRYILSPEIFIHLKRTAKGHGGEIQLTDAIQKMLSKEEVYAQLIRGTRYDCGSKLGYLMANIDYGLSNFELRDLLLDHMKLQIKNSIFFKNINTKCA